MRSSDRKSERAPAARFVDVTEGKLRAPSWVASQRAGFKRVASEPSFKAPRVPQDLHGIETAARSLSEAMPEEGAGPSRLPGAGVPPPSIAALVAEAEGTPEPARRRLSVAPPVEPDLSLVDAFVAAVDALGRARAMVLEDSAGELRELATTIARRVIARELATDPSIVEGLVDEGLAALGQHDRITVRLGNRFGRAATAIERRLSASESRVEIVLDPSLDGYGCVIETDLGRVDESVESRLSALVLALESDSRPPGS